jgi:hypothetical protein
MGSPTPPSWLMANSWQLYYCWFINFFRGRRHPVLTLVFGQRVKLVQGGEFWRTNGTKDNWYSSRLMKSQPRRLSLRTATEIGRVIGSGRMAEEIRPCTAPRAEVYPGGARGVSWRRHAAGPHALNFRHKSKKSNSFGILRWQPKR